MPFRPPLQVAASGFQARQLRLHRQQLVFPQGFHLRLQGLKGRSRSADPQLPLREGFFATYLASAELLALLIELQQLLAAVFHLQHQFLLATELQFCAQVLVEPGPLAVPFQPGTGGLQFPFHDPAAFLPLLHVIELAAGLVDAAVKQGHARQLIDDAAPFPRPHRNNPGDVPLHHHVAALGIHPQAPQLGLQLLQVAAHPIGAVAAAVGAAGGHPQAPGHRPFPLARLNPGALTGGLQAGFRPIRAPVPQVKAHRHRRLSGLALADHAVVDQIRQPLGPHAAAAGQAQAKQNAVENIALAGAIRPRNHREALLQGDGYGAAKRLEVAEADLIDVHQQDSGGLAPGFVSTTVAKWFESTRGQLSPLPSGPGLDKLRVLLAFRHGQARAHPGGRPFSRTLRRIVASHPEAMAPGGPGHPGEHPRQP